MSSSVKPGTWREYGLGGPPEPWEHGDQLDLDRLATSYYVDVLESRRRIIESAEAGDADDQVEAEELFTLATGHKQEIDFSLRHEVTPAERGRVEDRLQALMRISRRLRELADRVAGRPGPLSTGAAHGAHPALDCGGGPTPPSDSPRRPPRPAADW